jgi:hypothetical protein
MSILLGAIRRLEAEYPLITQQPIKASFELGNGKFFHALPARLMDGTTGCKTIWIDENSGRSTGVVSVIRSDGLSYTMDAAEVTRIRCGIMAVFCAMQVFPLGARLSVGAIGHGKIGRAVERAMREAFDVSQYVVLPSPRACAEPDRSSLAGCDIIITAASVRHGDVQIEFDPSWKARAFISFDMGFTLGTSFRRIQSICDYPAQLLAHWDDEFPFDAGEERPHLGLIGESVASPSVFYSYGIGIADLIVAEALSRG